MNRRSQTIYHRINKVEKTPSKRGDISNCISDTVVEPTCHLSLQLSYNIHKSVPQTALLLPSHRTRVFRITCTTIIQTACARVTRHELISWKAGCEITWMVQRDWVNMSYADSSASKRTNRRFALYCVGVGPCAVVAGYRVSTWSHQTWIVSLHLTHQLQNFVFIMIYLQSEVQLFKSIEYCRFVCVRGA